MEPFSIIQYSNAVLVAILPYVSEFAHKVSLPIQLPITTAAVVRCVPYIDREDVGGWLTLTNGYMFWFKNGHITTFETPGSFFTLQDPRRIPEFYGTLRIGREEAIGMARGLITKLGYTEEMLYADLVPEVELPSPEHGNTIPHFRIRWYAPNRLDHISAEVEMNADKQRVEMIYFSNKNLYRQAPPLSITLEIKSPERSVATLPPEHMNELLVHLLEQVCTYAKSMELPIVLPLETNNVIKFETERHDTGSLLFDNGFSFYFRNRHIEGFNAPGVFFRWDREVRVKDFVGPRRISDEQAIKLVRNAVKKLGYSESKLRINKKPIIKKPRAKLDRTVPRLQLEWFGQRNQSLASLVRAEVDMNSGVIKALLVREGDE